jgi:flagellin-like hook-associated protein FlgL
MGDIVLSAGVRQNLLSLQSTAALMAVTQNRLATGKKVNSALDNPINFFTSAWLQNKASDLNALLDSIGQAQQTLKATDTGITSLTKLVQSAKSIATQALQATKGTVNYTNITGTAAIAADTTRVAPSGNLSTAGAVSTAGTATLTAAGIALIGNGENVTFNVDGANYTFGKVANGNANAANGTWTTAAELQAAINHANGMAGAGGTATAGVATLTNGNADVTVTGRSVNDITMATTHAGGFVAGDTTIVAATLGDALTISDGTTTKSFYRIAGTAHAINTSTAYTDAASLKTAVDFTNLVAGGGPVAITAAGILSRADGGDITISGNTGVAAYGSSASGTVYNSNYNAALAALTGDLTVQVGTNTVHTITFGSGTGKVDTRTELNTALAAFTDITGSVDSTGHVNLAPTSTDDVAIGGAAANLVALGLNSGITTPTATVVTPNTTRSNLQTQFNDLLTQIDQLAKDASYNGVNLLYGDNLKVTFNENGSSSMSISGVKYDSAGLGLSAVSGTGFQDNKIINDTISTIDTSLATLRTQSSKFGSNLTTVQTRQEFTKAIINTLQTGADNLVLADSNEEAANVLALQTRQQLSTTALSLANQAAQGVLRLF